MTNIKRPRLLVVCIAGLALVAIGASVIYPAMHRAYWGARVLDDLANLKSIHLGVVTHYQNGHGTPDGWTKLIDDGYAVTQMFVSLHHPRRETGAEAPPLVVEDHGAWEQIGDVLLSRERAAHESFDARVIVAVMLVAGDRFPVAGQAAYLTANNSGGYLPLEAGDSAKYTETVEGDRNARRELGLSDPPDYAALIREHTAALKKK